MRIVWDLLEKLEKEDIPGLLVLLDFEKAFDTIEWAFIERTLQFYGFGPLLCKWIRAFYNDISSSVTNISEFFKLKGEYDKEILCHPIYLFWCWNV